MSLVKRCCQAAHKHGCREPPIPLQEFRSGCSSLRLKTTFGQTTSVDISSFAIGTNSGEKGCLEIEVRLVFPTKLERADTQEAFFANCLPGAMIHSICVETWIGECLITKFAHYGWEFMQAGCWGVSAFRLGPGRYMMRVPFRAYISPHHDSRWTLTLKTTKRSHVPPGWVGTRMDVKMTHSTSKKQEANKS
jgi:hypothetical protein